MLVKKNPYYLTEELKNKIERRLSITQYVKEFSDPTPGDIIIMGTYSRFWRNKKHREVKSDKTALVGEYRDSPTSHARDYLHACYTPKKSKIQQREILESRRMPLYASPTIILDGCYVDIKSAWFSIVNLVGWDCDYYPDKWFSRGEPPLDFPLPDNKVARSALVSLARSSSVPTWRNGIIGMEKMYNQSENPHIYGIVADVLNAIAHIAVTGFGCRYVATDGFILPSDKAESLIEFIRGWGLDARIKARGRGFIFGVGSYIVGDIWSKRVVSVSHTIDEIDHFLDYTWLHRRVTR